MIFTLFRALIYATAFIGILLIAVPARLLALTGQAIPQSVGLAQAVNVTGDWIFEVQTDQGSGTATVTFKQEGEKLTGKIPQLGAVDLTGTVKGNAIHFTFTRDIQGQSALVTYDGTVEKTEMKGTMNIAGVVNGTFTGKKKLE